MPANPHAPEDPLIDPGRVSVVLCTYNGGRFLARQLDSLLAQTYRNLEIVAVDDASIDESPDILRHYARLDPRMRLVINPVNLGFARNFANALSQSRGGFVAPCDQDDVWLPEKIDTLMRAISGHSMAYCDSTLVDENDEPLGYRMSQVLPLRSIRDPMPFAFGNCVSGHAMVFRRAVLARALPVPEGFFYDWWIAAVAASLDGIVFCERSLVRYRQHGSNITRARMEELIAEAGLIGASAGDAAQANISDTQSEVRPARERGGQLRYLKETERRLASLARLPGQHQPFAVELWHLWQARETQLLSPKLWQVISRHRERLLVLTGLSARKQARYCNDFLWGLRLKRLLRKRGYLSA